ncbi:MAG: hypothetical protein AAF411_11110 [Myxococcota bacterium]
MVRSVPALLALPCLALALGLVSPGRAMAYEEQYSLDVELGFGAIFEDAQPAAGAYAGAGFAIGLNNAWSLRVLGRYDLHPASDPLHIVTGGAEVYYLLDILKFVPFFGLGVDGFLLARDGDFRGDFGFHALVGIDWLISRSINLGLDIRAHILPFSITDGGIEPFYLTTGIRLSFVFDRY